MTHRITRRQFVGGTLATGALASGYFIASQPCPRVQFAQREVESGHRRLRQQRLAQRPGIEGSEHGRVVRRRCQLSWIKAAQAYPDATATGTFRKMLDQHANQIDAVVVSTADHTHAPATALAWHGQARLLRKTTDAHGATKRAIIAEMAARANVATQMGIQIHAATTIAASSRSSKAARSARSVRCTAGATRAGPAASFELGWPAPAASGLGSVVGPRRRAPLFPERASGQLAPLLGIRLGHLRRHGLPHHGPAFLGPGLGFPTPCRRAKDRPSTRWEPGDWAKAKLRIHARRRLAADPPLVRRRRSFPPVEALATRHDQPLSRWGLGDAVCGRQGQLAADYGQHLLLPRRSFADFRRRRTIPDSIGHWNEWVQACKTGSPTTCNFDYSGVLTETVLVGGRCLPVRASRSAGMRLRLG
jgi:hypothetical protein